MVKLSRVVLTVVVLIVVFCALASAEEGDVMIADFKWLRIRCPAAGYSIAQRADAIQARANNLLSLSGLNLSTVIVRMEGTDAVIYADGKLLATVGWCDARANDTTPEALAQVWAQKFKEIYPNVVPRPPAGTESAQ